MIHINIFIFVTFILILSVKSFLFQRNTFQKLLSLQKNRISISSLKSFPYNYYEYDMDSNIHHDIDDINELTTKILGKGDKIRELKSSNTPNDIIQPLVKEFHTYMSFYTDMLEGNDECIFIFKGKKLFMKVIVSDILFILYIYINYVCY